MSTSPLPDRPSLEFLKKLAKERLHEMRRGNPRAQLASALLAVAQDHGFASWRALKAEIDRRREDEARLFFAACRTGDVEQIEWLLGADPDLVHRENPDAEHRGWTGLHQAARAGHLAIIRLLLAHGANPDAREAGDNTTPLHWAAARADTAIVDALLDAGCDVQGAGDLHALDTIGWAAVFHSPGDDPHRIDESRRAAVARLLERGARHHIFSAIALGDLAAIQSLAEQNPDALDRRMSRFEEGRSPLHFALERKRYDILDLLIALGADVEAMDLRGRTALAVAMLTGDREATRRLREAGATVPHLPATADAPPSIDAYGQSVKASSAMIVVPDVAAALDWYVSIGFTEGGRYEADGVVNFGLVRLGKSELMFRPGTGPSGPDASLWFYTDRIEDVYRVLKARQFAAQEAALAGRPGGRRGVDFVEDLYEPFYGGREFGIRDLNGYHVYFRQPD